MSTDGDAGTVNVGVGLRVAGVDDLVDVDAVGGGVLAELVGQADVDVAVGGLGELGHLGGLGGAHVPDAVDARQVVTIVEVQDLLVELDALGSALVGQAANELRVATQVGEDTAGEDAFRGEDEVEVLALGQAGDLLDHRLPAVAGGADRQGGLVGDEGARGEMLRQRLGRGLHPAEVRLPGLVVDEQRDDENDRIGARNRLGVIGGGGELAGRDEFLQLLVEIGLTGEGLVALVDLVHDALLHVDADDVVTLLGELHSQGKPDLAHGDDGNFHS